MSSLTLASSRRLPLGDILQRLAVMSPCHLVAIDVVVRDVWQRCSGPSDPPRRRELQPVARPPARVGGGPAVRTTTGADAAAVEDFRQKLERIVRSGLFRAAVAAAGKKQDVDSSTCAPQMREGDIVVTRVVHHYSLGRVKTDGKTQTPIEVQSGRSDALSRARALAGADHRVFLYNKTGSGVCIQINGHEMSDDRTT
jgi:hypothetical protein